MDSQTTRPGRAADETFPLYVLHPSRHNPPAKVRAFIAFCRETIG